MHRDPAILQAPRYSRRVLAFSPCPCQSVVVVVFTRFRPVTQSPAYPVASGAAPAHVHNVDNCTQVYSAARRRRRQSPPRALRDFSRRALHPSSDPAQCTYARPQVHRRHRVPARAYCTCPARSRLARPRLAWDHGAVRRPPCASRPRRPGHYVSGHRLTLSQTSHRRRRTQCKGCQAHSVCLVAAAAVS